MAQKDSESKVLIIGAGLAGLLLGQILRKHSIPFELFERESELPPKDGWSVGLIE